VVWLGLGSLLLLAPALDAELGRKELSVVRLNRMVAIVGIYFVALVVIVVAARGTGGLTGSFPAKGGDVVAKAAAARPGALVYSNERFADWLMFEHPELRGRLAFDARFELLTAPQLQRIFDWTNQITPHWRDAVTGSGVVVLDMSDEQALAKSLRQDSRYRQVYRDARMTVFVTAS
jgi:hypothetical protein